MMILMKNIVFLMHEGKHFFLCKLLPSLDYPCTLDYKWVLLTTLSTNYADYQRFLLCKLPPFLGSCLQNQSRIAVLVKEKKVNSRENSQL